ncbi:MAG: sigma-54 dependent transcriptional regulator [Bilophila sp.]
MSVLSDPPLEVLVVDDDPAIVRMLLLGLKGHCTARGTSSAEAALVLLKKAPVDLVLTDMCMEGLSGVELVREVLALSPETTCVVMTAFASYETAVAAIKAGAFDYLPKPFSVDQLDHLIAKVSTLVALRRENRRLRAGEGTDWFEGLTSPACLALQTFVERIAPSEVTVLLTGETGSGKTELARAIHRRSSRKDKPFVEVMCTALAEQLFESEVFGHVRGAFTGAVRDHAGKFETADGGTLFLDEIGELSASSQAKLLRFLEDRVIERVGDNHPLRLDVRILAATNRLLPEMVRTRQFREDLYYRLNMFECLVPPLRERQEDIAPLALRLLRVASQKYASHLAPSARVSPAQVPNAVLSTLLSYGWPGNVRELRNVMERIALLAAGREAVLGDLPPALVSASANASAEGLPEGSLTLRELEAQHIRKVLERGVSMDQAAASLGITTVTLWRKRKELGLA